MKILLTRAIITLAASAATLAGYGMWYAVISNKSAEVAGLQSQIEAKTETVSRIASARAALSGIANDENIVQSYFVSEAEVVAFINDLEVHGKEQGAATSVLSVSAETINARPALLLALSVVGAFDAVLRTVGIIEYAPYDLSISDISVGRGDKNVWHADLKILVGSVKTNTQ